MSLSIMSFFIMSFSALSMVLVKIWIMTWIFLELNSLGLILNTIKQKKTENILLIFLAQSVSSMILLTMILSLWKNSNYEEKNLFSFLMMMAIFTKVGNWPFQSWIMKVSKEMSWLNNNFFMTMQKISPLILITKMSKYYFMWSFSVVSMMFLNMIMISQPNPKIMLTISSLIHFNWMIVLLYHSKWAAFCYLIGYSLTTSTLIYVLYMSKKNFMENPINKITEKVINISLIFGISGIPPTFMFFIKTITLLLIFKLNSLNPFFTAIMASACMSPLIYVNTCFKNFILFKENNKKNFLYKTLNQSKTLFLIFPIPIMIMFI